MVKGRKRVLSGVRKAKSTFYDKGTYWSKVGNKYIVVQCMQWISSGPR